MLKWVKLNKYYEISGDTKAAFYKKRSRGIWLENREYRRAGDGTFWVNLEAVERWAEKSRYQKAG